MKYYSFRSFFWFQQKWNLLTHAQIRRGALGPPQIWHAPGRGSNPTLDLDTNRGLADSQIFSTGWGLMGL